MLAALRDGTLQHGERLNDDELVQWLGVSRTPIREAIAKLVDIGLVEMEANRYTRVATPTFEDWVIATRATAGFFELSLRWGVPEYSDEDVEALTVLLDKADRMRKVRDYGFNGALTEIIEFAVEHSGNPWCRTRPSAPWSGSASRSTPRRRSSSTDPRRSSRSCTKPSPNATAKALPRPDAPSPATSNSTSRRSAPTAADPRGRRRVG